MLLFLSAPLLFAVAIHHITSATSQPSMCHVVSGGEGVRPGMLYQVMVYLCGDEPARIRASILQEHRGPIVQETLVLPPGLHLLPLKVPEKLNNANYNLTVEGMGTKSNLKFSNSTRLSFYPDYVSITIQTSRPLYTSSQTVRFRVLVLHTDLQAFDDAIDVFVTDPDGLIMRRWLSVYTNNGVASLHFSLPSLAKEGYWKIKVKTRNQEEDQKIKVENYFPTYFEVFVELPPYILDTEETIEAKVYGMYTSEEVVHGNATIAMLGQTRSSDNDPIIIVEKNIFLKDKNFVFSAPVSLFDTNAISEIKIEASIREFLSGEEVIGFAKSKIIRSSASLRFLSGQPAFFKPNIPFHTFVSIQYDDNVPLSPELLSKSEMSLRVNFHTVSGDVSIPDLRFQPVDEEMILSREKEPSNVTLDPESVLSFLDTGVLGFSFIPTATTETVTIFSQYRDETGNSAEAKLKLFKYESSEGKYLSVWTSTEKAVAGEYAIFHVESNFWMSSFQYLIVSKNRILHCDEVAMTGRTTSFPVATSPEMGPGFRILVFVLTDASLLSDSLYLPLDPFNRYEMELTINSGKDFKGDAVEIIVSGDQGAYICVHSVRARAFEMQAGNEISEGRVLNSLISFEKYNRFLNKIVTRSRDGTKAENVQYYTSPDFGKDSNQTFTFSGLVLFSHLPTTHETGRCTGSDEEFSCFEGGCYMSYQRCDSNPDCADLSDELNCAKESEDDYEFKMDRISRSTFLYDAEDGDWGWKEIKKNDHPGIEFELADTPFLNEQWYFNAFSVSTDLGFSIISEPLVYSTRRRFSGHVSGPESCRRGEQVGLRIVLKNDDPSQALILLRLVSSPDYKFVHVDQGGLVSSYSARLSSGQHQLLVYIAPESQEHIDFPIAPVVEKGEIEVKFVASTISGKAFLSHKMNILPEGAKVKRHTSSILDLKNRAFVLNYFDIIVEETPIVPYQEWRRYMYGSPKASFSVTGDIIGPIFPNIPMTINDILETHGKGTDARIFELGVNILTLNYLRFTNRITSKLLRNTLEECNAIYANTMKRFNSQGWFSNFDFPQPSVWLTAWILRIFRMTMYADWENILYIDITVFHKCLLWIVKQQSPNGSFVETKEFSNALKTQMRDPRALTAHVLLALNAVLDVVEGEAKSEAVRSQLRAVAYLEANMPRQPYSLSLVTLALSHSRSSISEAALLTLRNMHIVSQDSLIYWSSEKIPGIPIKIQNQRPFVGPRLYLEGISEAVETTSWALLCLLQRYGVTPLADKVVLWINSVRMTNNGFISLTDTMAALEALTEYANRARLVEMTKMDISVQSAVDTKFKHIIHITNETRINPEPLELETVWGDISLTGRGAGLALVQLDVSYGVDWEPLLDQPQRDTFQLTVREYYGEERNKSAITVHTCFRWVGDGGRSGPAVLELEVPTGYRLVESQASLLSADVEGLSDAITLPGLTVWFFDMVGPEWSCFNHTVRRWHPVANMTLYRQALLYEIHAREHFVQVVFNSTPLYVLNICEVCGSYQCPYCPFYNKAGLHSPAPLAALLLLAAVFFALTNQPTTFY